MAAQIYEYTGTVEEIGQTQSFGSNGFTKREVIVGDPNAKYPNPVKFTFKKDNCSLLDGVKKGDQAKVRFAIDGRRWDGPRGTQYFVDLTALKIEIMNADGTSTEPMPTPVEADVMPEDLEDMPF